MIKLWEWIEVICEKRFWKEQNVLFVVVSIFHELLFILEALVSLFLSLFCIIFSLITLLLLFCSYDFKNSWSDNFFCNCINLSIIHSFCPSLSLMTASGLFVHIWILREVMTNECSLKMMTTVTKVLSMKNKFRICWYLN